MPAWEGGCLLSSGQGLLKWGLPKDQLEGIHTWPAGQRCPAKLPRQTAPKSPPSPASPLRSKPPDRAPPHPAQLWVAERHLKLRAKAALLSFHSSLLLCLPSASQRPSAVQAQTAISPLILHSFTCAAPAPAISQSVHGFYLRDISRVFPPLTAALPPRPSPIIFAPAPCTVHFPYNREAIFKM